MKKNRMMRLASILLVCVLLTTSVISGTFAKYITSDSAEDTARVAKWGIDVQVGGNLFGQYYKAYAQNDDGSNKIVASSTSVARADGAAYTNIVAPGTMNDTGFKVSISGTPEVAYSITAETSDDNTDIFLAKGQWGVMVPVTGLQEGASVAGYYTYVAASGDYKEVTTGTYVSGEYFELHDAVELDKRYYPIVWEVVATDDAEAIATVTNLKDIVDQMVAGVNKITATGDNGNANDSAAASYTLTWEWPFANGNDEKDTILGNLAVDGNRVVYRVDGTQNYAAPAEGKYCLDIAFDFEVTVEQID